jgi:hypothetical protein
MHSINSLLSKLSLPTLDSAGRAIASRVINTITYAVNVVERMTLRTRCDGSDGEIEAGSMHHVDAPGPYNEGKCLICHQQVPIRYASMPAYTNHSGIRYSETGKWVTLPHEKPFTSHCADCGTGLYVDDYLCGKCRRASLTA